MEDVEWCVAGAAWDALLTPPTADTAVWSVDVMLINSSWRLNQPLPRPARHFFSNFFQTPNPSQMSTNHTVVLCMLQVWFEHFFLMYILFGFSLKAQLGLWSDIYWSDGVWHKMLSHERSFLYSLCGFWVKSPTWRPPRPHTWGASTLMISKLKKKQNTRLFWWFRPTRTTFPFLKSIPFLPSFKPCRLGLQRTFWLLFL